MIKTDLLNCSGVKGECDSSLGLTCQGKPGEQMCS